METKLTNEELHKRVYDWVKKLCETGGNAWTLRVPADHEKDPDLLITELINRHKASLAPSQPSEQKPPEGAEQILKKYKGFRESWVPHGPINLFGDRAIISAMQEYAQQSMKQERDMAIQECIDSATEGGTVRKDLIKTLEKLKSKTI